MRMHQMEEIRSVMTVIGGGGRLGDGQVVVESNAGLLVHSEMECNLVLLNESIF